MGSPGAAAEKPPEEAKKEPPEAVKNYLSKKAENTTFEETAMNEMEQTVITELLTPILALDIVPKSDTPPPCMLFYFPFSLYSMMARLALSFGRRHNPWTAPRVDLQMINLHRCEHLVDWYLRLNPKGQVSQQR